MTHPIVIIVMGVSGAGKTTVGRALATALGWAFIDADDLHPTENIDKMRRGIGLSDTDRAPWLDTVRQQISDALRRGHSAVVACSALKRAYRTALADLPGEVRFVDLRADLRLLEKRLAARAAHFAGSALLPTQFADLEDPGPTALTLDASASPAALVSAIRRAWEL